MNYTDNRLQFIHSEKLFDTSQAAKDYVNEISKIERPALYAEPMILKYGDAANPNVILAIGSVGTGDVSLSNRVFFIDVKSLEDSIASIENDNTVSKEEITSIKKLIKRLMNACGVDEVGNYKAELNDALLKTATSFMNADLILSSALQDEIKRATESEENIKKSYSLDVKDTNSVKLTLKKSENGMILFGNVKVATDFAVDKKIISNSLIKTENGLFINVDLNYNDKDSKLVFSTNGESKELQLPKETHLISGEYDYKTESIILTLNRKIDDNVSDSDKIKIDLKKLIGEWTVLGNNSDTPIVLTKEPCSYVDELHGVEKYQDILKANIRIIDEIQPEIKDNILTRSGDGRALYVKGTADNIIYWKNGERITVKEALDAVDDNVSKHDGNIIYRKEDGIFANVELEYIAGKNTLKFSKTNKNGQIDVQELALNNITFLENIYYDSLTEELVVQYKDATGEIQELRVPVSSLFEEWVVDNTNHTVTLTKTEHQTAGKDKLSADVNIASTPDNILRVVNHGLHVKGTSDNIKHDNGTVKDALDLINASEDTEGSVRNLIKKEKDERVASDEGLRTLIDNEKTRAEAAEKVIDEKVTANTSAIEAEVSRATSEEYRIETKFDTAISKQGTVNTQITESIKETNTKLDTEISRSTSKDSELENAINKEIQRASGEEKRIEGQFNSYKENAEQQHKALGDRVTKVEEGISKETEERIKNDQTIGEALSNEIVRAKESEGKLTSDISTLNEKVNNNTNSITTINEGLLSVNQKIDDEISRAQKAENANTLAISEEKAARETKDTELKGLIDANSRTITSETNRAKAVEQLLQQGIDDNKSKIESEVSRATAAEKANSDAIIALEKKTTMTANNTGTITLTKSVSEDGNGYSLSGVVNVSNELGNIINSDDSALKATVDLVYDGKKNTLTLKTSNNADKVIALNQGSIITSIRYESSSKELVITYQTANGEPQEVRVNVSDLFNEIKVENPAENAVTLKMSDNSDGSQTISADVNVSTEPNNLLQKVTGNLYVSNAASGIKFEDGKSVVEKFNSLSQTVNDNKISSDAKHVELEANITKVDEKVTTNSSKIESLEAKDAQFDSKIQDIYAKISSEETSRVSGDTALGTRIDDLTSKVNSEIEDRGNADNALDVRIKTLETNLPKEVQDRTNADENLRKLIQANTDSINSEINKREKDDLALGTRIDTLDGKLTAETNRAIEKENSLSDAIGNNKEEITNIKQTVEQNKKDATCSVKNTESISLTKEPNTSGDGYILSGNVLVSTASGNIIGKDGSLFASVDLQYNSANNTLTLVTSNNANKEIKLNIGSIIRNIYYDSENKRLVITYVDENQQEQTVYVPVSDLYNDWIVEDRDESVIKLTKVPGLEGQPDVLKADLKLASPQSGNLLQNTNGNLYASNKALDIKLSDHVGTNVEAAIINLNERVTNAEGSVSGNTELVKDLEKTVNEHTTLIKNNSDRIDTLIIDNNQNKQDIVDIEGNITEINEKLEGVDSSINEINTTIGTIEKNIEDLQAKTDINAQDTNTVDLTFTHSSNSSTLKADIKVSKEENNLITIKEDGLHVLEDYDFGTY